MNLVNIYNWLLTFGNRLNLQHEIAVINKKQSCHLLTINYN
jgi:hypothetical protein